MFCKREDLKTESDVEQKLLWQLLTAARPNGLGYSPVDIATKPNIRTYEFDKGSKRRRYFPDYVVILAGLPVLIVEAKAPGESLIDALEEARLYAIKINESFPHGINPCTRVLVCNGDTLATCPTDSSTIDDEVPFEHITPVDVDYGRLVEKTCRTALHARTSQIVDHLTTRPLRRPLSGLGGQSVRNEEIGHNTFGSTLALDFRHLFDPTTLEDRAFLVKNAYVASKRRDRYVEPIDKLIRGITPPAVAHLGTIEDSAKSREVAEILRRGRALEHQIMLLVGSVGSGKSTYVDYLVNVALPQELIERTHWLRLNMNNAPRDEALANRWLIERMSDELRSVAPNIDVDSLDGLKKLYAPEIRKLNKGVLSMFQEDSSEYKTRLYDAISRLQADALGTARALARFLCGDRGRLLVVVLDNCDKRNRDEQLLMFQLAHWIQNEFKCLVVLPLRDVTYDLHRGEPPLDTAQKDLVFRIEPPKFSEVLSSRVALALKEMSARPADKRLSYVLPNGIRVEYPASDQGMYLASILTSLYEHDRFLRRILSGLAGRNIRKAIEMFLDFCSSGHINEGEILKIRKANGNYVLPIRIVAQVLLRMNRRFYDGDKSHVKNIFQCATSDPIPDHFVRLAILRFLSSRLRDLGPSGVRGFHRSGDLVARLVFLGHDAARVRAELLYLLKSTCIIAEHQRIDDLTDADLISLSPGGSVHLELLQSIDYVAACVEDLWMTDTAVTDRVAARIGGNRYAHLSDATVLDNAKELVDYLSKYETKLPTNPAAYASDDALENLHDWNDARGAVARALDERRSLVTDARVYVGNLSYDASKEDVIAAFTQHGLEVADVFLAGGNSKGYAFVSLTSADDAARALDRLQHVRVLGRAIRVAPADKRPHGRR
jgi:hypothetical protein